MSLISAGFHIAPIIMRRFAKNNGITKDYTAR